MKFTLSEVFTKTFDAVMTTPQFVSSCGGTRSGKTFAMLQVLYILVCQDNERGVASINSVVSQTFPHLDKGAITDFKRILGNAWRDEWWNEGKHTYTFQPSGAKIEFFSADKLERVHGPARDRLYINEAQTLKWETVQQLLTRTRGISLFDYNPTHEFWLNTEIENTPLCITIHSTYLDNVNRETGESLLSDAQVRFIESQKKSAAWWRVYGLGLRGQLEGLIYPEYEQIDEMPDPSGLMETYGMDFGFNDPTTIVRTLADRKRRVLYVDELLYEANLRNKQVAERMLALGISPGAVIYGDCASPTSIAEINYEGRYNVKPCSKAKEVVEQIQFVQGWELRVTKRSLNVVRELNNYQWAKDRDGKLTNQPDKDAHQDHALDAMRYALFSRFGAFRKPTKGGTPIAGNLW